MMATWLDRAEKQYEEKAAAHERAVQRLGQRLMGLRPIHWRGEGTEPGAEVCAQRGYHLPRWDASKRCFACIRCGDTTG
jgi:hypothetical protein